MKFYIRFFGRKISSIEIEDLADNPHLISDEVGHFKTIENDVEDGKSTNLSDWVSKTSSNLDDSKNQDLDKMLISIMIFSGIMMLSDINKNKGNIGIANNDGKVYPVVIDFLDAKNSSGALFSENKLSCLTDPNQALIKDIIDNKIPSGGIDVNIGPFYCLLVKQLAKKCDNDPGKVAEMMSNISKDILRKDFRDSKGVFWDVLNDSINKLANVRDDMRSSNKRFLNLDTLKNDIKDMINWYNQMHISFVKDDRIRGELVEFSNRLTDVVSKSEFKPIPGHVRAVHDRRPGSSRSTQWGSAI